MPLQRLFLYGGGALRYSRLIPWGGRPFLPVPHVLQVQSKTSIDRLEGANVGELTSRIERWKASPAPSAGTGGVGGGVLKAVQEVNDRLHALVNAAPVMVFIKGSPEEPKCKFSRQLLGVLQGEGVSFGSFDVLSSEAVRQGLKEYSNWPTFPQLYVNGQLVGGVDIVQELKESGELATVFPAASRVPAAPAAAGAATLSADAVPEAVRTRVYDTIGSAPVVLLMKGSKESPACGFSERLVGILKAQAVPFKAVDVLADPPLREASKILFQWPTFPALFVKGQLVGGVDAVQKLLAGDDQEGKGEQVLPGIWGLEAELPLKEKLQRLVDSAHVVLFMKGTAEAAQCGFSARTVDTLASVGLPVRGAGAAAEVAIKAGGAARRVFASVNILADPDVRQGMKEFSSWPTFPQVSVYERPSTPGCPRPALTMVLTSYPPLLQLYVGSEFVGGADIIAEMKDDGSLAELLAPFCAAS